MNLFVDTSVWSLAWRRDDTSSVPEVERLSQGLAGDSIFTTGIVLQELLQGFRGPRARDRIIARFSALPCLLPTREDHIAAADVRNLCRRRGIQVGTIDALLAQLCVRHGLTMLTTDRDFERIARVRRFRLWRPRR